MSATDVDRQAAVRADIRSARTLVVKVGSALLSNPGRGLDKTLVEALGDEISALMDGGRRVLLVSSGAVAEGMSRLGLSRRPDRIHELQAAAAVGQMGLVQAYERAFARSGRHAAVVLLTHDDMADRQRYLNARATLSTLLDFGAVPVINENDSVATDEIRFGDNDTLAAMTTNLLQADVLILLTDTAGLFERDPREDPAAPIVRFADAVDPRLDSMVGSAGSLGRGGMITKLKAARLAARSGAHTVIAGGSDPTVLSRIASGAEAGTLLAAGVSPLDARKRWIAGQQRARGRLLLDAGAVSALVGRGVSLLPVGVTGVEGEFSRGALVQCVGPDGRVVAQGLCNYSSAEASKMLGAGTQGIVARLGYSLEPELIHRDNLVILA
ncbi:MAG TPA: glutamate 5-kinase [Pseudomonadales bacterium]